MKEQEQNRLGWTEKSLPSVANQQQEPSPAHPTRDWLESAERDYAFSDYEFFGREWGEKLIEEVRTLREVVRNAYPPHIYTIDVPLE